MDKPDIHDLELTLLLEGVFRRWGYDFRDYARASLRRRVTITREALGVDNLGALQHRVLHDRAAFDRLAFNLSVCVTELFRDPPFFAALREQVLPVLATYPFIKVWHAGCATGEEVYSLAVLFDQAGLLERTTFFGTDFNAHSLAVAREGIYPLKTLEAGQKNFLAAGGNGALMGWVSSAYDSARFAERLRRRMVFSLHNLAVDQVFSEVQLVVCRNVLIYFNKSLQQRALDLFAQSLVPLGVLALGSQEGLGDGLASTHFEVVDLRNRLYRRVT